MYEYLHKNSEIGDFHLFKIGGRVKLNQRYIEEVRYGSKSGGYQEACKQVWQVVGFRPVLKTRTNLILEMVEPIYDHEWATSSQSTGYGADWFEPVLPPILPNLEEYE